MIIMKWLAVWYFQFFQAYYFHFYNPKLWYCQRQNWARVSEVLYSQRITSKAVWAVHMVPPSVDKWNCSSRIGCKWFARFCIGLYGNHIQNVFNCRTTQNISYVLLLFWLFLFVIFYFKSLFFAFLIFGTHFYQFAFKFSTLQLCS